MNRLEIYVAGIVGAVLILIWFVARCNGLDLEDQVRVLDGVSKVVTVTALFVGGVWALRSFIRERISEPRLNTKLEAETIKLDDGASLVKVFASVENVGNVLVHLIKWRIRAEQLMPETNYSKKVREKSQVFLESDAAWISIALGNKDGHEIDEVLDPGETIPLIANLIIPDNISVIQIYSHLASGDSEERGWESQKIIRLDIEGGENG